MTKVDASQRFLFSEADIRGESVSLSTAFQALTSTHPYSDTVKALLGEFAAAAVLISNNLKYRGKIIIQARTPGDLQLVMVECTSDLKIRGVARGNLTVEAESCIELLARGQLALTIERDGGQRYQGIVAIDQPSLAACLEHYFSQSEQLQTRFWLAADGQGAAGLMLQQLPAQLLQHANERQTQWETTCILAETTTREELLALPSTTLLHRLFNQLPHRIFEQVPVAYQCSCSRQRSLDALNLLPVSEQAELLGELGQIDMNCEMCGTEYSFTQADLPALAEGRSVH